MDEVKRFVGIDVAKVALDVFIGSVGKAFSVARGCLRLAVRWRSSGELRALRLPGVSLRHG